MAEAISLSQDVAKSFGKSSITLLPGTYIVDYGASTFGTVQPIRLLYFIYLG
jgi:multisubunit Na+/H+ antiporter MnhE subunit